MWHACPGSYLNVWTPSLGTKKNYKIMEINLSVQKKKDGKSPSSLKGWAGARVEIGMWMGAIPLIENQHKLIMFKFLQLKLQNAKFMFS